MSDQTMKKNRPRHRHSHPLMRPSQGHRESSGGRNPGGQGLGIVVRSKTTRGEGLVPRCGRAWAWQNSPRELAIQNRNSGFSSLGVPAPTGMSDWYEDALKRLSSAPANPSIRHSREGGNPRTNIPRKNANRDTITYLHAAIPLRHYRPHISSFGRQPQSCSAGACPPRGRRRGVAESAVPIRRSKPHLQLFLPSCSGASRHQRLL